MKMNYRNQLLLHGICIAFIGLAIYLLGVQIANIRYQVQEIERQLWSSTNELIINQYQK